MTNRMDHTNCTHEATPKGRAWCRNAYRAAIKGLQAEYMAVASIDQADAQAIREYEAGVDLFSGRWGIDFHEAFNIIENGPVIH